MGNINNRSSVFRFGHRAARAAEGPVLQKPKRPVQDLAQKVRQNAPAMEPDAYSGTRHLKKLTQFAT
eukprot:5055936-Alexandrium_andersonii.AAC.1